MVEDAVLGDQFAVHREGEILVGIGHDLGSPGIGAGQRDALVDEPLGRFQADSGLPAVELVVVLHPELAPARVEEHRIALLDVGLLHVLLLQSRLQVGDGDLLPGLHHRALQGLEIEQVAAREERLHVLDAELLHAVGAVHFLIGDAVVVAHLALVAVLAHLDADMGVPVWPISVDRYSSL